jgi:hypothetical protein
MAVPGVVPITREMLGEILIDHCDSLVLRYDLAIRFRRNINPVLGRKPPKPLRPN